MVRFCIASPGKLSKYSLNYKAAANFGKAKAAIPANIAGHPEKQKFKKEKISLELTNKLFKFGQ
ncbi:hypothetical protein [Desulforamulus ruminis]|uniref:hypothetical protein n=1 Tax=Desulforamulus ruminis TaxID=1564 RepID=UPI0002D9072A|nr:hypothetical protein [Desulforamulus ruminis]